MQFGLLTCSIDLGGSSYKGTSAKRQKAQYASTAAPVDCNKKSAGLTNEENNKLQDVQRNDAEMDDMLGAMDVTAAQKHHMDAVSKVIDKTNDK